MIGCINGENPFGTCICEVWTGRCMSYELTNAASSGDYFSSLLLSFWDFESGGP